MKNAGIEVRIGRLVVDVPQHGGAAGFADAIGVALRERLTSLSAIVGAANARGAPQAIADRIATRVMSAVPGAALSRGKP